MSATPRILNGVCLDVSPEGCARQVEALASAAAAQPLRLPHPPHSVLVLGCSGGYGLAARVAAACGAGARTLGVSFEREPAGERLGSPGWYNNQTFDALAARRGLPAMTLLGDAFTPETKARVATAAEAGAYAPFDLVIYSLAAPQRRDPVTGITHRSAIKPIGQEFHGVSLHPITGLMRDVAIGPATDEEIADTVKVMGGEDWELWLTALAEAGLLAKGARTVAFSYLGSELTRPIYRTGTLGRAKDHLEATAHALTERLRPLHVQACVAVCQATVTRASAVIPAMPLYIAALYKVMKRRGLLETPLAQMTRLLRDFLYAPTPAATDTTGRIRLDDRELQPEIQAEVGALMAAVTPENLREQVDFEGYHRDFMALHGL